MAERRMFSKSVVNNDTFLDLPPIVRCLYFQLCIEADDDGFNDKAKSTARMIGATSKDLDQLIDYGFIIRFPNGVVVDAYWLRNNSIRKDRYKPTIYKEEFAMLELTKDGTYKLKNTEENQESIATKSSEKPSDRAIETNCQPNKENVETNGKPTVDKLATQVRLGKVRLNNTIHKSTTVNSILSKPVNNFGLPVDNYESESLSSAGNVAVEISGSAAQGNEPEKPSASLDGWMDKYKLKSKDAWDAFWEVYPRKQGTVNEIKAAFLQLMVNGVALGDLICAAEKYAQEITDSRTEKKYIKMPLNFLQQKIWRSYIPRYLPSCPYCHGKGVYQDSAGMHVCNCDARYKGVKT